MAKLDFSFHRRGDIELGPSAREAFLLGAEVYESNCTALLAGRSGKGRAIRSWVHEHYAAKYVPKDILEVLGPRMQLWFRWQSDERRARSSNSTCLC